MPWLEVLKKRRRFYLLRRLRVRGGLTDVFKAYANTASVNGNEPNITIIDQASASAADARRSSSFFYSFMNSDDENEEKSTLMSRKVLFATLMTG
jgi:hypothetical protein